MNMAETFALKRALEDPDFRSGLTAFFSQQMEQATTQAVEALNQTPCQIEQAIKHSAKAETATQSFTLLEVFTRENLART
jgi:hypothetical protein